MYSKLTLVVLALALPTSASAELGRPIKEHILLRPQANSFYSVDALNPDVIRWRGRYWLYFSGNSVYRPEGDWRTGVAVSKSPLGPFHVLKMQAPFLNGSTFRRGRFLYQLATPSLEQPANQAMPILYRSRNGTDWQSVRRIGPQGAGPSDVYVYGDRTYFAYRTTAGADIASASLRHPDERRLELEKTGPGFWDGADLGEPGLFNANGQRWMLYVGGGGNGRQVGLARWTREGWAANPKPLIPRGSSYGTIDPEPLVVGNKLYVYYGVATRPDTGGGDFGGSIAVRVYKIPSCPRRPRVGW